MNGDLSQKDLTGKISLVTGGTSGIGGEVAQELSRLGSKVFVTGRNEQKGRVIHRKNNLNLHFHSLDMANWNRIKDFCNKGDCFDYIVLNAGGMPDNLVLNDFSVEHQCASQLIGHYYLIYMLKKYGKDKSICSNCLGEFRWNVSKKTRFRFVVSQSKI